MKQELNGKEVPLAEVQEKVKKHFLDIFEAVAEEKILESKTI